MFTIGSEENFRDGDIVIKEGSVGDWVYVILSGSVEVSKMIGGTKLVLDHLGKGEIFGELSFIGGGKMKRSATVMAAGPTIVGIIDRNFLDTEFNKLSSEFRSILISTIKRFIHMMERTTEFSSTLESTFFKTLSISFKTQQSFLKAFTGTVQKGSLFVRTNNPLKTDEIFNLKLQLPGLPAPISIKCQVEWANVKEGTDGRPAGMKINFKEITGQDNRLFTQYMQSITRI